MALRPSICNGLIIIITHADIFHILGLLPS